MNILLEKLTGMDTLTDQVIAMDFLNSAKTGARNYVAAITETATPEVEAVFRQQLEEEIVMHEKISNLMMNKGWYHAYEENEQIRLDLTNAQTALNMTR